MDGGKRSEQEDGSDMGDSEGASSGGDGGGLRRRTTADGGGEASDSEPTADGPGADRGSSMGTALVLVTLAFVVFSSLGFYYNTADHSNDVDPEWITEQLTRNVRIVRSSFPSQTKTIWADLYSGIQKVLLEKPTEPSVFLLVHEGSDATASCLARKVGGFVQALLDPSGPDVLVLEGSALSTAPRPQAVAVLADVQLVPAGAARGLGVLCRPAAHPTVNVLTLRVTNDERDPSRSARKELNAVWNSLDRAALSPLVACVTGGHVIRVHPEPTMAQGC